MSCRKDVKQSVVERTMQKFFNGRHTFDRISEDTVQIAGRADGKTKANSPAQARAIAKSTAKRIAEEYQGQVRLSITQASVYDPILLTVEVNPAYVEYLYNRMPNEQRTDNNNAILLDPSSTREEISSIFEQNKELSSIGNQLEYSSYLNTIFPNSKIKNIVYRGENKDQYQGDKEIHYSPIKNATIGYGKTHSAILNIVNPLQAKNQKDTQDKIPTDNDAVLNYNPDTIDTNMVKMEDRFNYFIENIPKRENETDKEYSNRRRSFAVNGVFEEAFLNGEEHGINHTTIKNILPEIKVKGKEQIHILGSNKDIEGFKAWKQSHQTILLAPATNQNQVNNNAGNNTNSNLNSSFAAPVVGYFTKFIQSKKQSLVDYEQRLHNIEKERNTPGTAPGRLIELNRQRRLVKKEIEGVPELNEKGLRDEIAELESKSATLAVGYYVEKDLERIAALSASDNIDELNQASDLIEFYELSGTFATDVENPFFQQEDIFLPDPSGKLKPDGSPVLSTDFKLDQFTRDTFADWRARAVGMRNQITKKYKEVTENTVNNNRAMKKTFGGKVFSFEDITYENGGLKDTAFADMWLMDITHGIFSHNGYIPQVMFSELSGMIASHQIEAREIEEVIDRLNPQVIKRLKELKQTLSAMGVIGNDATTYQLFKEITKEGNETGNFIQKYVKEFSDQEAKAKNKYRTAFSQAKLIVDNTIKNAAIKKAFQDLREWRRKNTIVMKLGAIPSIINDPEFAGFAHMFDTAGAAAHEAELTTLLGKKEYNRKVAEQVTQLKKYVSDRQSFVETLLIKEGVAKFTDLSTASQYSFEIWEKKHSPFYGVDDYHKVTYSGHVDNFSNYNIFIPRRYEATIKKDATNTTYEFTDTAKSTGNYDETFENYIENDPVLSEFHDLLIRSNEFIRECLPYEHQLKFSANSLPAMMKSSAEIIMDRAGNTGILLRLVEAYRLLWDKFRQSFGVMRQSETTSQNSATGRTNYKVNDSFMSNNQRAIKERMIIEKTKFLQAFNSTRPATGKVKDIKRFSVLALADFNHEALVLLADYLNVDISLAEIRSGNISKISAVTGTTVDIGRIIRDNSLHEVVQSHSFDLAKVMKYATYTAAMYAARNKSLPVLEVMKAHYESIQNPKTTNLNRPILNILKGKYETEGDRNYAKQQIKDWFNRVVVDNYGVKHVHEFKIGNKDGLVGNTIYSNEERAKMKEIEGLLANETDPDKIKELQNIKDNLGKARTLTALVTNMLTWIRTMRLGYNFSSAVTNMAEGWISNMLIASEGQDFNENEVYYAYNVVKHSFIKNITFGKAETALAKKNRILMDKYRVIMDSKNELQKSSEKTMSNKLDWLNPHALNQRVEFMNQSVIMIAMLRTIKIKDVNGNESSVWNAYTKEGELKPEFKTADNVENWEHLKGEDYLNFKEKLSRVIVKGHGNYDELRGMAAKSRTSGKAIMMFKTWIPEQLYWRFATEQDDIASGTIGYKGKYWSYHTGSGALHGAVLGMATFGPLGAAIGAAGGALIGATKGVDPGVGLLRETLTATLVLAKKMIGMPINSLVGGKVINTEGKEFDAWVGKGNFTQADANALKANMADIGMQLMWLMLLLAAKMIFWDDDDDKIKAETDPVKKQEMIEQFRADRAKHNLFVNKFAQLGTQSGMYVNLLSPTDAYQSTIGSNAVVQYVTDVTKWIGAFIKFTNGDDTITTGTTSGESRLWNQTRKTFMPGIFKDKNPLIEMAQGELPTFGFKSQTERQFKQTPFDDWFKSDAKIDEKRNKGDRAERKDELDEMLKKTYPDPDERAKAIKKQLNEELPTPKRLKKLGVTREEYEKNNQVE